MWFLIRCMNDEPPALLTKVACTLKKSTCSWRRKNIRKIVVMKYYTSRHALVTSCLEL